MLTFENYIEITILTSATSKVKSWHRQPQNQPSVFLFKKYISGIKEKHWEKNLVMLGFVVSISKFYIFNYFSVASKDAYIKM